FVSVDTNSNGTPRVATYRITGPGGIWDAAENGSYTVTMVTNQVKDTSANAVVAGALGSLTINISDTTAPTATLSASNISAAGGTSATFTVTYTDDIAVNVSTLTSNDVLVTGPKGFSQLATFVSVNTNSNGTPRVATYSIAAPG